jgi:Holliday junction DNA helicase RuvA
MITFLNGQIVEKQPTRVVLDVGGVGYEVLIPISSYDRLPQTGESCRILTFDHVREDAHVLFGFMTGPERDLFVQLIGVNGIGPKLALSVLSGMSVREIKSAVVEGDVKRLSSVSGVGKKTAERLVVELRHRMSEADFLEAAAGVVDSDGGDDLRARDAILALTALGHAQVTAQKMVRQALAECEADDGVETVIKKALAR